MKKTDKNQKTYKVGDPNPRHPELKLLTRRDFLSSGVLGFSGGIVLPTVMDLLLMERAKADGIVCPTSGAAPGMIPFIIFDCAGGASLPGNWIVGSQETRPVGAASFAASASQVSSSAAPATPFAPPKTAAQVSAESAFNAGFRPLAAYDALGLITQPGGLTNAAVSGSAHNADFRYGAPMSGTNTVGSTTTKGFNQTVTNGNTNIQSGIFTAMNNEIPDGTNQTWTTNIVGNTTNFEVPPAPSATANNFQSGLRMGTICHSSLSDSGSNMLSAVSMITSAGSLGSSIRNGLGMRQSNSAGNSDVANLNGAYRPMGINSVNSLSSALTYGPAFSNLPGGVKQSVARALASLTDTQSANFASMNLGQQLATLTHCGHVSNAALAQPSAPPPLNATNDPNAMTVFNNGNPITDPTDNLVATLMLAALTGGSGPAVITIGGCDYHTGNRTTGETTDAVIGKRIGQAVHLAGLLGKAFAFQVFTDGGIASMPGSRNWQGDDNQHSLTVFGVFDPTAPRDMVSTQINTYTSGQAADETHFLGNVPANVASAVLYNYLAVTGKTSQFQQFVNNTTTSFSPSILKSLLLFKDSS